MKGLKVSMVIAVVMTSFAASGQRTCLDGCQDGNRVSLTFNPRAAQAMFDSLYFRLDSLTAYVAACGCGGAGTGGSTSGGGSGATPFTCGTSTVTFDGHAYSTVQIGTQCWFAENLRTTQYADNSAIPEVNNGTAWSTTNNGARAAYNNDPSTYGYLYNWYAVDSAAGLCPTGWHVPTDGEWMTLANGLGGPPVAGREMKSSASDNPSWDGTNSTGFSGIPGGFRLPSGAFIHVGTNCFMWSTTPAGGGASWGRSLSYLHDDLYQSGNLQTAGFSVRCLQDVNPSSSASAPTVSSAAASALAETTATLNGTVNADGGDAVTATGFVWGTDALLSAASNASGSATSGSFTASLTGLTGGTTYYFSAYATNGQGTDYGDTLSFTTTPAATSFTCGTSTVTFDGHAYTTVLIGTQCWFAENLRTTQYADNSAIPEVTGDVAWHTSTTDGARAAYDNDASNLATYGYLYNWKAVNKAAGLCPSGWHVPTEANWVTLRTTLGGNTVAGGAMKSSSSDTPPWNGSNSSLFSGLPGGYRSGYDGLFSDKGVVGQWWSATQMAAFPGSYWNMGLDNADNGFYLNGNDPRSGFSVRCLQD